MGCLQLNNEQFEGRVIEMGNKKKSKKVKKIFKIVFEIVVAIGSLSVIAAIVIFFTNNFHNINENMTKMQGDINNLSTEMQGLKEQNSIMYYDLYDRNGIINKIINEMESKVDNIKDILGISVISATSDALSYVNEIYVDPNNNNLVSSSITEATCIGTDSDGNAYIAEDLINTTILLTYTEGDKEVYFLGQYNENYRWNGYCVTNAYYMDGTLYGICESNFENGQRLDYKSFYKEKDNEWTYSNRVCTDEGNLGTSIGYTLEYNKVKNFTNTNVRVTDILYVDKFIEAVNPLMRKYYHGNTSGGVYNDDSGQAYYVEYFEDGTVKTLYQGNFIGGQFNDNTDEAWYIVKEVNTRYMYYKGFFEDRAPLYNDGYEFENPINLERINEIIQDKSFECELNWATE